MKSLAIPISILSIGCGAHHATHAYAAQSIADSDDVELPIPPLPEPMIRQPHPNIDAQRNQSGHFATPPCLVDKVRFWTKVYTEIDRDDVFLHDRNDLGRIFETVNLPRALGLRTIVLEGYRTFYRKKLESLALRFENPESWDEKDVFLASLFSKDPNPREAILQAAKAIRAQSGLREQFARGLERSRTLKPHILEVLNQYNLPEALAYLPHVESSYNPKARSKVGALGLWQIMPSTMKHFPQSLRRRSAHDPKAQTEAAARILLQNYKETGSWPLALTAYNHGLGGIKRAITQVKSRDLCEIIARYESRSFRFASKNFYAQFLASMAAESKLTPSNDRPDVPHREKPAPDRRKIKRIENAAITTNESEAHSFETADSRILARR